MSNKSNATQSLGTFAIFILGAMAGSAALGGFLFVLYALSRRHGEASKEGLEFGDIATWSLAILTLLLAGIAWRQLNVVIRQQREEIEQQSKWASLQTTDRYDSDPVMKKAKNRVLRALENPATPYDEFYLKRSFVTLFNYFDSIAIGLECGMYHEEIMRRHIWEILDSWMRDLAKAENKVLQDEFASIPTEYKSMAALYFRWAEKAKAVGGT